MHEQQRTIRVGHYTFDRSKLLGKGSTGCVYLGTDTDNNREVACKVVDMSKVTHEVTKFLLENEKAALRMLHHTNILKCYEIYQQNRWCYIVTEYCNEGTLSDLIRTKGCLNEDDALDIFDSIVEGYKLCVEKKITHRDLKPANILMHNGHPKISDFGYCQVAGYPKPSSYYNVGSPCYMSPEALISSCYSEKSDVWSLGVILYEMLCGQPFDKPDEHMIVTLKNIYDSGGLHFPKGISAYCKKVIRGCLQFDVHKRFTTKKLLKVLEDSSDAEETTIIDKFDASPEKEDIMRSNPLSSIGNVLKQFQPNNNGIYSLGNVPVALRAMLEKQLHHQSQKAGFKSQNVQPRQTAYHVPQQPYPLKEGAPKRNSRVRSLDVRMRPISSPIYKQHYQIKKVDEQPMLMSMYPAVSQQIRQVHHRYRPMTANREPSQVRSMQYTSPQQQQQQQQYGKLLFKESADQQIPNVRYMNPIFPSQQETVDYQWIPSGRSLSIQSNNFRSGGWGGGEQPPLSPQTYQQQHPSLQRFPTNANIEESTNNFGYSQPQEVYGLRLNQQKPKTSYPAQQHRHPHRFQQPPPELLTSEYFSSFGMESPRSTQHIRNNTHYEDQLKC